MREPERVLNDVLRNWETIERARETYGVVLIGDAEDATLTVDDDATCALRTALQDQRADTKSGESATSGGGRT